MAERSRGQLPEGDEDHVSGSWRRFKQALADMDNAGESEDFQGIDITRNGSPRVARVPT
jgi:hypothetical protein